MGLIKEPLDVDFVVDNRPLTTAEEFLLDEYIKNDKIARCQTENKHFQYVVKEESAIYQKQTK